MAIWGLVFAFIAAAAVARAAHGLGWLDRGGAAAATAVGGTIFAFAGWRGAALLLAFFVTSSLLSRLPGGEVRRARRGRSGRQVLANGGVPALCALLLGVLAGEGGASLAALAFAGSLAAVTADTWASEIGRFFGQAPRSAITMRTLEPGESGGVTVAGTSGGLMGAAAIGWMAALVLPGFGLREAAVVEAAGAMGMWFDSVLGASLQFKGRCGACGRVVEDARHEHALESKRGLPFVDNDAVNMCAAAFGAGAAAVLGVVWT